VAIWDFYIGGYQVHKARLTESLSAEKEEGVRGAQSFAEDCMGS